MAERRDTSTDHLTFSQRYGYEPLPGSMRLEELSDDLRRKIWNVMRDFLTELQEFGGALRKSFYGENRKFVERILGEILKLPGDEISHDCVEVMNEFKLIVMDGKFNRVLDLIEAISEGQEEPYYIMTDGSLDDVLTNS